MVANPGDELERSDETMAPPPSGESTPGKGWAPGAVVAGCRIERMLGRGGMGEVFAAVHLESGNEVAIKTLRHRADPRLVERFRREGRAQARVDAHPHVARVRSGGQEGGRPYLIMDLVTGGSLRDRLTGEPQDPREAARTAAALARGLQHCHDRGVLHRDLKPDNVMFDAEGRPKLMDFGLAKTIQAPEGLTKTGEVLGTPSYMSPEQADGSKALDERTDVYGLGAVFYELLTGRKPFDGSLHSVLAAVLRGDLTPPSQRAPLPAGFEAVVFKAMALDPAERYRTAAAFAEDLERLARGEAPGAKAPRRRSRWLVPALVLLALGGVAIGAVAWPDARGTEEEADEPLSVSLELVYPKQTTRLEDAPVRGEVRGSFQHATLMVNGVAVKGITDWQQFEVRVGLKRGPNLVELEATSPARRRRARVRLRREPIKGKLPRDLPGITFREATEDYVNDRDGSELIYLPPGDSFTMGDDEALRLLDVGKNIDGEAEQTVPVARPEHRVRVERGFLIGRYEVTYAQYLNWVKTLKPEEIPARRKEKKKDGSRPDPYPPPASPDHPITALTWYEAQDYCEWAGLELPTEAQWEYAARGGDGRTYPWGNDYGAWPHRTKNQVLKVTDLPENTSACGAVHMAGNVWEWTRDQYSPNYAQWATEDRVARQWRKTLAPASDRALRGASWFHKHRDPEKFRAAYRRGGNPAIYVRDDIGFRVSLTLPE